MSTTKNDPKLESRRRSRGYHWQKRIIVIVCFLMANCPSILPERKNITEIRGHSRFTLSDASKGIVWAMGLITLDNDEFNRRLREITATGNVYIDMPVDASKPVVIHVEGGLMFRSNGGAFEKKVDARGENMRVLVGSGSVELLNMAGTPLGYLQKGEEAVIRIEANTHDIKIKRYDEVALGDDGINVYLRFENITMAEVATRLQRHFEVEVAVSPAIRDCNIYATFHVGDMTITDVLGIMQKSLRDMEYKVAVDKQGNVEKVRISGRGCGNSIQRRPKGAF